MLVGHDLPLASAVQCAPQSVVSGSQLMPSQHPLKLSWVEASMHTRNCCSQSGVHLIARREGAKSERSGEGAKK